MESTINETIEKILSDPLDDTPLDNILSLMEEQFNTSSFHIPMKPTTIPMDIGQEIVVESNAIVKDSVVSPMEDASGIQDAVINNFDFTVTSSVVSPLEDATRIRPAKDIKVNNKSLCNLQELTQRVDKLKSEFISLQKAEEKSQIQNIQVSPQPATDTSTQENKQRIKSSPYPGRHARKNFLRRQRARDRHGCWVNLRVIVKENHRQVVFGDKDKFQPGGDCDDHTKHESTQNDSIKL